MKRKKERKTRERLLKQETKIKEKPDKFIYFKNNSCSSEEIQLT